MSVVLLVLGIYFLMATFTILVWTQSHVKDGTIFDPLFMALFPTVTAVLSFICFWYAHELWP